MQFTILSTVIFLALSTAAPLPASRPVVRQTPQLNAATDSLLFDVSIEDFGRAFAAQDPKGLDWYSNGCTASPDQPFGFNFKPSCQRHDFGYHNYKAQNRFSKDNKAKIDSNFKDDMYAECDKRDVIGKAACKGIANVYYGAVSAFGGLS